MAIKLYGCSFSGNNVDFSFGESVTITCLNCGHSEKQKGAMKGEPKCPACSSKNISISDLKQQEVK